MAISSATYATESIPADMLHDYMIQQAHVLFDHAEKTRAAINTPEQWERRRAHLMDAFEQAIGPFPETTPLNARIVGTLERPNYTIQKIVFESRPLFYVTAVAYVPKRHEAPYPGILFPPGHSRNGKAYESYQRTPAGFAEKGYLVLVYDPLGQGERWQYWDPVKRESAFTASTREHSNVGAQCLLLGINLAQFMIWDSIRALDYLISREDVDPERIGCTGVSGGGTNTAYYVPFDERIKAAMPTCYIAGFPALLDSVGPQDAEQNLFGQLAVGLDHEDYLALVAPRPLCVGAATEDYFPLAGARRCVDSAQRVYDVLGVPDNLSLAVAEQGHGYNLPMREAAYTWFNQTFNKQIEGNHETKIEIEPDEDLWCTETGNVYELGSETVFSLNQRTLEELDTGLPLVDTESEAAKYQQLVRERVRRVISAFPLTGELDISRTSLEPSESVQRERIVFESEPGILVPGVLRMPIGKQEDSMLLWVDEAGKDSENCMVLLDALAVRGVASLALDPRGIGETGFPLSDDPRTSDNSHISHKAAYMGFLQARPLLGMRVQDVMRGLDALAVLPATAAMDVVVGGSGGGALLALFAAALDQRAKAVVAHECLASYRWLAENEHYAYDASWFLFGVLREFDICDVASLVAPRPLAAWTPHDHQRQPVGMATLLAASERTTAAYRAYGAPHALRYRDEILTSEKLAREIGV
jgi:cephalosporin-C deacetylase-like acetyl esterase